MSRDYTERVTVTLPEDLITASIDTLAQFDPIYLDPPFLNRQFPSYVRDCLRLFNVASQEGFDRSTRVTASDDPEVLVHIPALRTSQYEGPQKAFGLALRPAEKTQLTAHAERLGISKSERVGRALGFGNFILNLSSVNVTEGSVTFIHREQRIRLLLPF